MAKRTIEAEVILSGEKAFNDSMKTLNNNLKNLDAEMKVVSTAFDENASATDKLKAKQDILTRQIDQQKEKVRALNAMYEKQKTELGEDSAAADKYRQQTLNAQAALNKMEAELRKTDKELEDVAKSENKAGDEAQKAAPKIEKNSDALKKVSAAAKTVGSALGTVAKKFAETGVAAARIGLNTTLKGLSGLGAAAGTAGTALITLGAKGFSSLINMSLEAANSEWSFWRLRNSMSGLSRAAEEAKTGLAKIMAPALESFTKKATVLLKEYNKEIKQSEGDTEEMGRIMARYLRRGAELIRDEAPAFTQAAGGLLKGLTSGIIENEDELEAVAGELISQITDFLDDNADDMGKAAAVLVRSLGELIGENAPALMRAGFTLLEELLNGLNLDDAENAGTTVGTLVADLLLMLIDLAPDLIPAGIAFVGGLWDGIVEAWPTIGENLSLSKDELVEKVKGWAIDWEGAGAEWMKALLAKIQAGWSEIVTWWDSVRNSLGPASFKAGLAGGGFSIDRNAVGLDTVPSDYYLNFADKDEMILKAPLARELRAMGVTNASSSLVPTLLRQLDGAGQRGVPSVNNKITIEFTGSLAQLGRVLQPHIKAEEQRRGPQYVK